MSNEIDRVFAAASAACQEATRRWFGDPHDRRFDVPLAMLLDLADTLDGGAVGAVLPDSVSNPSSEAPQPLSGRLAQPERAS